MKRKLFCTKCGSKLIEKKITADKVIRFSGAKCCHRYFDKYNRKTGKIIFGVKFFCPKLGWFNKNHDSWTELKK